VIGDFLFIVCGYLVFVEAINHTSAPVELPVSAVGRSMNGLSRYHRSYWEFGQDSSPIGFVDQNLHQGKAQLLLCTEYPPIEDVKTKHQITATLVDTLLQKRLFADAGTAKDNGVDEALEAENEVTVEVAIVGRKVGFRIGRHVFGGTIGSRDTLNEKRNSYIWRAWTPGMTHMGICCSVVFFVSTIIFFIPACALYPMYQERPSLTAKVFWVYVLQVGHVGVTAKS
jgi:hypothetical protein